MAAAERKDILQADFTKYERAQMIGARALQISMGAPFKVKLTDEELTKARYNPIEIAKIEYDRGVIPMRVVRPKHAPLIEEPEVDNSE